jgi:hypothetical protein
MWNFMNTSPLTDLLGGAAIIGICYLVINLISLFI